MMTLIAHLCALCAMGALLENLLCTSRLKDALHAVIGLLMLRTALVDMAALGERLGQQNSLQGYFNCLIK